MIDLLRFFFDYYPQKDNLKVNFVYDPPLQEFTIIENTDIVQYCLLKERRGR